ncbi:Nn.00g037190.m01.CDS01 [Neocucurbitaria sp. VM-36]
MSVLRPFRDRLMSISVPSPTDGPSSPTSSPTSSPDNEPDTPDWTSRPHRVLSRLKSNTFPLNKKSPEGSQSPTLLCSPTWDRPRLAGRSQTAPPTFQRRNPRESEKEYDGMPEDRKAAANARVNNMRTLLGLKVLDVSTMDTKPSTVPRADKLEGNNGQEGTKMPNKAAGDIYQRNERRASYAPFCLLPSFHGNALP